MSSFNEICRVDYQEHKSSVIVLLQYILFTDDNNKDKFAVFKFKNNLNQNVYSIRCEVCEYNSDDLLLEKQVIEYNDLKVKMNEEFVPNAKLKLNSNTKSLRVNLTYARFERVTWENNDFKPIVYTIDDFRKDSVVKEDKPLKTKKVKVKVNKYEKKEIKKLKKRAIYVKDCSKLNRCSKSFVIFSIIVLLLGSIGLGFYYKMYNHEYYDGVFQYIVNDNEVYITSVESKSKSIDIPNKIDGKIVKSINKNAFANSGVEVVNVLASNLTLNNGAFRNAKKLKEFNENPEGELVIGASAFENCESLESITLNNVANIYEYTFRNCSKLKTINLPNSNMGSYSLVGVDSLEELTYGTTKSGLSFYSMFGSNNDAIPSSLTDVSTNIGYIFSSYFGEIPQLKNIEFLNKDCNIAHGALTGLNGISGFYNDSNVSIIDGHVSVDSNAFDFTLSNDIDSNYLDEVVFKLKKSNNVRTLRLENERYNYDESFFSSFPNLKDLYLAANIKIEDNSLDNLLNLNSIHLYLNSYNGTLNCETVDILADENHKENIINLKDFFPNVKNLTIGNGIVVNSNCLSDLNLQSLTLPISTLTINELGVSKNLKELNLVYYKTNYISSNYIDGYDILEKLIIPEGIKSIRDNLILNCNSLNELVIPSSVTSMSESVIGVGCDNLTKITTPFVGTSKDKTTAYSSFNNSYSATKTLIITGEMAGSSDFSKGLYSLDKLEFKCKVLNSRNLLNNCHNIVNLIINDFDNANLTTTELNITNFKVINSKISCDLSLFKINYLYLDNNSSVSNIDFDTFNENKTKVYFEENKYDNFDYDNIVENSKWKKDTE